RSDAWPPRYRTGRSREDEGAAGRPDRCGRSGKRPCGSPTQRTEDRRCDSGVLVSRTRAHFAVGRWARRTEAKGWRAGRQSRAGHARRLGGRIADLAGWHLGRPANATVESPAAPKLLFPAILAAPLTVMSQKAVSAPPRVSAEIIWPLTPPKI